MTFDPLSLTAGIGLCVAAVAGWRSLSLFDSRRPSGQPAATPPWAEQLIKEIRTMSSDLAGAIADLQSDVSNLKTVDASAIALIQGLAKQLADALAAAKNAGATPDQLQALTDLHAAITAQDQDLADAVSANTPAPPAPDQPAA